MQRWNDGAGYSGLKLIHADIEAKVRNTIIDMALPFMFFIFERF